MNPATWEITSAFYISRLSLRYKDSELALLLQDGWEPFQIDKMGKTDSWFVWLRRQVSNAAKED